jgi:hypothetical protein
VYLQSAESVTFGSPPFVDDLQVGDIIIDADQYEITDPQNNLTLSMPRGYLETELIRAKEHDMKKPELNGV